MVNLVLNCMSSCCQRLYERYISSPPLFKQPFHLDEVKGLGQLVELEAVTEEKGVEESHRRVEALMRALEITSDQLVKGSYGDIVAAS